MNCGNGLWRIMMKVNECWVVVRRGRPTDDETFGYIDAVEEALCFWLDRRYHEENGKWSHGSETGPAQKEKFVV